MNQLQFRYDTTDDRLTLRPFVDGLDLLDTYKNSQGRDPDDLLPPLSSRLLPTRGGHVTIVGVCSCGESGCGSLALSIRRDGNAVLWEPTDAAGQETLARTYTFELRAYLDAVDLAAGDPPAGEGRGRRAARTVRRLLGMYDQHHASLTAFHHARIDWVSAWPWTSDTLKASVTTLAGQTVHEFAPQLDETEARFAARACAELSRLRMPPG